MGLKRKTHESEQDFELALAPIIDCFVVLITFMLASASFLSIGILDAGVAAESPNAEQPKNPPPIQLRVEIQQNQGIKIHVTGKETTTLNLASKEGDLPLEDLKEKLESYKKRYPTVEALTLEAQDGVQYEKVVRTMDSVSKVIPSTVLGGF